MFYLQRNLPWWERALRVSLGVLLALGAAILPLGGVWLWLAGASAAILVMSGAIGFCPACVLFGRRPLGREP